MADKKISDLTAASSVAGTDVVPVVQTAGGADDPKKATVTQVLAPHAGNTSNPHAVTKAQVGLANVQNVDQTNADNLTSGTVADARIAATIARDSEVSAAVSAEASARDTAIALAIANLIASAPGALDTLNELATALGNDPNFATTMTNALAGKQPLDSDLTAIAALAPADDAIIQRASGIWVAHTPAQVKATLALTSSDVGLGNVPNVDARARSTHTGTQSADTLTDGTTNKAFLATERTKLAGVATGATANSSDATLLARANHTGTQLLATISDAGALASRATVGTAQIDDDAATNAKLANMAANTVKARTAATAGDPQDNAAIALGGSSAIQASASLDLQATDKALLLNRLTTAQRDALTMTDGLAWLRTDIPVVEARVDGTNRTLGAIPHGRMVTSTPSTFFGAPGCAFTGAGTSGALSGVVEFAYFLVESPVTVDQLICEVTTLAAASNLRMGIYAVDAATLNPTGAVLYDSGNISAATAGVKTHTLTPSPLTLKPGWYCTGLQVESATTRLRFVNYTLRDGVLVTTLGASPIVTSQWVTQAYGTFPTGSAPSGASTGATAPVRYVFMRYSSVNP